MLYGRLFVEYGRLFVAYGCPFVLYGRYLVLNGRLFGSNGWLGGYLVSVLMMMQGRTVYTVGLYVEIECSPGNLAGVQWPIGRRQTGYGRSVVRTVGSRLFVGCSVREPVTHRLHTACRVAGRARRTSALTSCDGLRARASVMTVSVSAGVLCLFGDLVCPFR